MDILEDFILALLLEATGEKSKDNRAWLSYNWGLADPKVIGPGAVHNWQKLHHLTGPTHFKSIGSNLKGQEI